MSEEMRQAAVAALAVLSESPDHRDRADAGRALASFAELPRARGPLSDLLLDAGDTSVTRATAEALLRRQDAVGLTAVASALAAADPDHVEWIHTAVLDVFGAFAEDRDAAVQLCGALFHAEDDQLSRGADLLMDMLAMIEPAVWSPREEPDDL